MKICVVDTKPQKGEVSVIIHRGESDHNDRLEIIATNQGRTGTFIEIPAGKTRHEIELKLKRLCESKTLFIINVQKLLSAFLK